MTTLFISDLHLDATRPGIAGQFIEFLRGEARAAAALYILGDLFEIWIGDDDPDPDKRRVLDALRELTQAGVPCYFIHGNRDFLIGRGFAERTGIELLADGTVVEVDGRRALLMHGDVLCIDDHSYQRLRRIVRNPLIKWIFRRLSLTRRSALAERIRAGSREHTDRTPAPIMDVNAGAVNAAMARYEVDLLIHGHTHRPAVHRLALPRGDALRIVLGDWYEHGSVLRAEHGRFDLTAMPRPV
jgi:UDP-2,3-diacylglucosamine hydrolase